MQLAVAQPYDHPHDDQPGAEDRRPSVRPPRSAAGPARRTSSRATRALFDQRGVRDAQIEDIAKAVGINRAIVYRHFTGKEELFALTLVGYLDELRETLAAVAESTTPSDSWRRW